MKTNILQKHLQKIVSIDKRRPAMNYIYFNKERNEFCATNGSILTVLQATNDIDSLQDMPAECLIPVHAFAKKYTKGNADTEISISIGEQFTEYILNDYLITTVLKVHNSDLDNKFPDYQRIIPDYSSEFEYQISFNINMLNALSELFKVNKAPLVTATFSTKNRAFKLSAFDNNTDDNILIKEAIVMPLYKVNS